jgi:hypothetical protein
LAKQGMVFFICLAVVVGERSFLFMAL